MLTPIAPRIILTQNARSDLQALSRAHSTPQSLALRARIVLRAAHPDRPTNQRISCELGCDNRTVGKWRRRYLDLGLAGLQDAIRLGRLKAIAPLYRVQVISVASSLPQEQDRSVTRWTLDEIVTTLLDTLNTAPMSHSSRRMSGIRVHVILTMNTYAGHTSILEFDGTLREHRRDDYVMSRAGASN